MGATLNKPDATTESARPSATPSTRRTALFYSVVALLAVVGVADSLYLTVEHLTGRSIICAFSSGCSKVLASRYSKVGPVPLAGLGVAAYFSLFSLAVLAAFGHRRAGRLLIPLVSVMFGVTLWLLFAQAFLLHAFCDYCLLSAGITTSVMSMVLLRRVRETPAS